MIHAQYYLACIIRILAMLLLPDNEVCRLLSVKSLSPHLLFERLTAVHLSIIKQDKHTFCMFSANLHKSRMLGRPHPLCSFARGCGYTRLVIRYVPLSPGTAVFTSFLVCTGISLHVYTQYTLWHTFLVEHKYFTFTQAKHSSNTLKTLSTPRSRNHV